MWKRIIMQDTNKARRAFNQAFTSNVVGHSEENERKLRQAGVPFLVEERVAGRWETVETFRAGRIILNETKKPEETDDDENITS